MILVTIKAECPYCKAVQESDFLISSEIDGNYVIQCDNCDKRFLVHWFLIADSEVHKIENATPPVRCTAHLESYDEGEDWNDDDDDDEKIQPQA